MKKVPRTISVFECPIGIFGPVLFAIPGLKNGCELTLACEIDFYYFRYPVTVYFNENPIGYLPPDKSRLVHEMVKHGMSKMTLITKEYAHDEEYSLTLILELLLDIEIDSAV